MIRMKEEIEAAIKSRKPSQVREIYSKVFNRQLAKGCNSCIPDAIIELEIYLQNIILGESKINLFVNLYKSDNALRQKELDKCLELNEANEFITRIIPVPSRNYNDIFRQCVLYPNDVNIIANADIFFNETIQHAKKIWKQYCYALTRWDYKNGQAVFMNRKDSQDVWIFRGVPKVNAEFELGQAGCDNHLAYLIKKAGYVLRNPSLTIQAIHLHEVDYRTYKQSDRIPEPYHFLEPTELK